MPLFVCTATFSAHVLFQSYLMLLTTDDPNKADRTAEILYSRKIFCVVSAFPQKSMDLDVTSGSHEILRCSGILRFILID